MPGPPELLVIAIVAVIVLFGAKKLPEIARAVGRSQSEFKKGVKEGQKDLDETDEKTDGASESKPGSGD
jgi:sec-independent protein translocase protein TatA